VGIDSRLERDFEAPLTVPGRTEVSERQLTIEMELVNTRSVYNDGVEALDWERCAGSNVEQRAGSTAQGQGLRLRNWRPGDQYQPLGRSAAEKIKTLFQEFRVPLWERRAWPVVVQVNAKQADSIIWSRRFGVASQFAAGPESRRILTIREVMDSKPRK
jgi:tRNA(Ile)-lysidine synthase